MGTTGSAAEQMATTMSWFLALIPAVSLDLGALRASRDFHRFDEPG